MESKKINQLATNVNPQQSDLTTIGDPITGQLKKITWLQVAHLIGAQASVTLQQVTDNGNTTTDPITTGGLTLTNLGTGVPRLTNGEFISTYGYGLANGVATLDSGGKIPASQLPSSVMEYKGTWNASTNTPTLADGTGDNGDVYLVNVAGSQNLGSGTISFAVGDWVVYNGTIWQKSLNSNAVASVFGRTGTIVAQEGDYNIDQLGDVAITSAATNDYLRYNGSSWVNTQFPTFVSSDKLVLQVRNNSGATINKGTVVYINGATAGYPTIAKAQADADATSAQTIGVVQDNISNNSNGIVVLVGQISGVDTSAFTSGTQLYLSGTTAGAYTSAKALAPTHLVYVGVVTAQNAVNGVIEVKIQNGYELEEIHDVAISSVANNQGLFYESSTDLWKNKSIATVLGYTPEQPLTFSSPLVRSTNTISIPAATGSVNGYLTSTDWTTFNNKLSAAIISLNGLTAATQTFATGSSGTDFNISSTTSTHTFNIPSASATNRGLVTTGTQTFAGDKTFNGIISGTTAAFSGALAGYGLSVTNIEDSSQGLLVRSTDADTTLYLARFQSSASAVSTTWVDRFSIAKNGSTVIGDNIPAVNIRLWVKGEDQTASNYALDVTDSVGGSIAWFRNDKAIRFYGDLTGVGASFSGNISAANLSGTNTGDQTLSGLGGVPTTRTITINGTSFDLSANRTYSVGTIGGSGTSGYVSKFTGSTTIGNSIIYDSGSRAISIGNSSTNSWASPFYVIEGGTYGQFIGFQTNNPAFKLGTNSYFNGSNYIYTNTGYGVSILDIGSDATNAYLDFYGAPTGTAGNAATISKKFSIDNTGNAYFVESLGVGFTSGTINGRIDFRNAGNAIIVGKNTTGGTNTYSSIRLTTANSGGVGDSIGEIRGLSTNVNNRDIALTFLTSEGSAGQTEKMRITAGGNVGIGTTDPQTILNDFSTNARGVAISNAYPMLGFNDTDGGKFFIGTQSNLGYVWNNGTDSLIFGNNGAERMRITSGGNVGIGTTPSAWYTYSKVLQLGGGASIEGRSNIYDYSSINTNSYADVSGTSLYMNNGYASRYYQYLGSHNWLTAPSGTAGNAITFTQAMTLDASGRLGIGTTSPNKGGVNKALTLNAATSTNASYELSVNDVLQGSLYTNISDTSVRLANFNSGDIVLVTGATSTERMRITSGGYLKASNDGTYIGSTGTYHEFTGTTAASDTLSLRHKAASQPFGQSITFSAATPNNLDQYFLYCQDSTNVKAIIWSNGTFNSRTNTYTSVSDINLKQDIIDASSQWNDIKNLTVRKFRLKDEVAADSNYPYHIGVVAQELELISPNLVDNIPNYKFIDGEKVVDGHIKTVKYSILYMKAIKALQEAMERIEKLEAKLN